MEKGKGCILLGSILPLAMDIEARLKKVSGVIHATIAGSIRRRQETVGEIDRLNTTFAEKKFRILKSAEVNILKDGSLDIADGALKKLDLVCVAVHSHFALSEHNQTERIVRALKHPLVNILFHLTGRRIDRREAYALDMEKILRVAKEYGVAMEANASPDRLDLKDTHIRRAIELGVKLVVDSDAHAPRHFGNLNLAV